MSVTDERKPVTMLFANLIGSTEVAILSARHPSVLTVHGRS